MNIRKLQLSDFDKNLNNLLAQLTESPEITKTEFQNQFLNLSIKIYIWLWKRITK